MRGPPHCADELRERDDSDVLEESWNLADVRELTRVFPIALHLCEYGLVTNNEAVQPKSTRIQQVAEHVLCRSAVHDLDRKEAARVLIGSQSLEPGMHDLGEHFEAHGEAAA